MLASEFSEIKGLLLNLQRGDIPQARAPTPQWDEDALSTKASCSQFREDRSGQGDVDAPNHASDSYS
ncbi:hypothetical protein KUCAC02_019909 [Chaenocephalus aceratus]|uniref:Uncharacterized protein n=1 Tax=Chaenocephalus aceratus TaxID=36190 RepID=A0ACB9VQH1_CHAAC|nr:hypothetical protein KUCAC02_019909 [Chaenocephalus aceratus]